MAQALKLGSQPKIQNQILKSLNPKEHFKNIK